jgi:hypothetical protein
MSVQIYLANTKLNKIHWLSELLRNFDMPMCVVQNLPRVFTMGLLFTYGLQWITLENADQKRI